MQPLDSDTVTFTRQETRVDHTFDPNPDIFQVTSNLVFEHTYQPPNQTEAMSASATLIGRRQQLDSEMDDLMLTDDHIDSDYIRSSRTLIQNLLNPESMFDFYLDSVFLPTFTLTDLTVRL